MQYKHYSQRALLNDACVLCSLHYLLVCPQKQEVKVI